MPRLGAHMSIAGGLWRALERGAAVGCQAVQLFTQSSNRWVGKPVGPADRAAFLEAHERTGRPSLVAHNSYLINLASPDPVLFDRSVAAMIDEVERCAGLGIPLVVLHPGAHMGQGVEAGLDRVAVGLERVLTVTRGEGVGLALETTAGQGTCLGHRLEHLAAIRDRLGRPARVGVCLDTCHLFAAGYDLASTEGFQQTLAEVAATVGLDTIRAVHLNDSRRGRGSRVDRHAHIGQGQLGLDAFRHVLREPAWRGLPAVLETPKGDDLAEDRVNLAILRGLRDDDTAV